MILKMIYIPQTNPRVSLLMVPTYCIPQNRLFAKMQTCGRNKTILRLMHDFKEFYIPFIWCDNLASSYCFLFQENFLPCANGFLTFNSTEILVPPKRLWQHLILFLFNSQHKESFCHMQFNLLIIPFLNTSNNRINLICNLIYLFAFSSRSR